MSCCAALASSSVETSPGSKPCHVFNSLNSATRSATEASQTARNSCRKQRGGLCKQSATRGRSSPTQHCLPWEAWG